MVVSELIQSVIDMPDKFADVATQGPIEGFLVAMGGLLVALPLALFGILVLGAIVDLILPDSISAKYP